MERLKAHLKSYPQRSNKKTRAGWILMDLMDLDRASQNDFNGSMEQRCDGDTVLGKTGITQTIKQKSNQGKPCCSFWIIDAALECPNACSRNHD